MPLRCWRRGGQCRSSARAVAAARRNWKSGWAPRCSRATRQSRSTTASIRSKAASCAQQSLNIRLLGASRNVETPANTALYATGNNLTVVGDLTRRTLICALDAKCERPELRTFADDIRDIVLRERGHLVAAALTVLRAWQVSGERVGVVPLGSFESWSYRVREPLIWLGGADPCETITKVREDDPRRNALLTVLVQWKDALGTGSGHTTSEIIAAAVNRSDFHNALLTVAAARSGNVVSHERLGRWFTANEGKIVNRFKIVRDGIKNGYTIWTLNEAQ
jgi:putative DNA primase/helicase